MRARDGGATSGNHERGPGRLDNEVKVTNREITVNLSNEEEAPLRNRNRVSVVGYRVILEVCGTPELGPVQK